MRAAATRTAGDCVLIGPPSAAGDVLKDVTLSAGAAVARAAVALHGIASGDIGLYCVAGPVDMTVSGLTVTAYHGLKIDTGAVATTGAGANTNCAEANTDFCVALAAITNTDTSARVYLLGEPFTKS